MAEIRVRNVDDQVLIAFRDMARRHGRSVAEEARRVIADAVVRPRQELIARLDRLHADILAESGVLDDSTPWIRQERERM
jgi:plasmid stability protein